MPVGMLKEIKNATDVLVKEQGYALTLGVVETLLSSTLLGMQDRAYAIEKLEELKKLAKHT